MITYKEFKEKYGFEIASVVNLIDRGSIYPSYYRAFEHFGILIDKPNELDISAKDYRKDLKWIVKGIAVHGHVKDAILVHIVCSELRQHLVVGVEGLEVINNELLQSRTKKFKVENYEIFKVKCPW